MHLLALQLRRGSRRRRCRARCLKPVGDARDGVGDQAARQAVELAELRVVASPASRRSVAVGELEVDAGADAPAAACPSGPALRRRRRRTLTVTPFGIVMGFLPIRDIVQLQLSLGPRRRASIVLPDVAEHFAADARLHGGAAGHDAARRRQDAGAEARRARPARRRCRSRRGGRGG